MALVQEPCRKEEVDILAAFAFTLFPLLNGEISDGMSSYTHFICGIDDGRVCKFRTDLKYLDHHGLFVWCSRFVVTHLLPPLL